MEVLSKPIKQKIFDWIIKSKIHFLGKYVGENVVDFVNKIWDLRNLPSEDDRFPNAYADAFQHLVNNDDWDIEYLFLERFKLIIGDEKHFIDFIETVVHPQIRNSKDEITQFVKGINSILSSSGYRLILTDYFEELPIYKFKESKELSDLPIDIIQNKIPIYVDNDVNIQYPSFILVSVKWNDFGICTRFTCVFCKDETTKIIIGKVKIMKRDYQKTKDVLPSNFTSLEPDFCSLGEEKSYYYNLKEELGTEFFYGFLLAIRDVAMFPKIYEEFEYDNIFTTSLIRYNETERLSRTIRFEIQGLNPNEYFKFNYTYQPPYADNPIKLPFDFDVDNDFEQRVYAIIGKNGTGKTQLLASLAKHLSEKENKNFSPNKPIYGKVFTISYSFFDKFEIPKRDAIFNYVYCGLKKTNDSWKTETDMLQDFQKSVEIIIGKKRIKEWYKILENFISDEILAIMFSIDEVENYTFHIEKYNEINKMLSSGQSIILYLLSEVVAEIRYDSLILFDEPETHLHPNAINDLINTIFNLVNEYKSFCIIATHSPLIIQEITARNVFVIEREGTSGYVRKLERESFGENLTVITQDIFGNKKAQKHFITVLKKLIAEGKSYEEIIKIVETDQLPVTSNIRLYIKSLMK
jgi:predicted ATPase